MEVKGKVIAVLPENSGISQRTGQEWKSQDFVLEYYENPNERYADSVVLRVMNDKVEQLSIEVGDTLEVGFALSARNYNGKWYQEARPYKIVKVEEKITEPEQEERREESSELPFA